MAYADAIYRSEVAADTKGNSTSDRYPYPTRVSGAVEPMERADPTVWSVDAEGPMDGATIAAYDRRGFSEVDGPAVIFVVFNSVENALVEPFSGTGQRPTFIANREFVPVTR